MSLSKAFAFAPAGAGTLYVQASSAAWPSCYSYDVHHGLENVTSLVQPDHL
jgi:hypothetical protein